VKGLPWSIFFITGIVYVLVSVPLLFNKLGPNRFYGIRIAKAYESTEMWYKVNRIGAKIFLRYGVVMLAVGVVAAFISTNLRLTFAPLLIGNSLLTLASIVHVLIEGADVTT